MKSRTQHDTAYLPVLTLKANGQAVSIAGATVTFLMRLGAILREVACTILELDEVDVGKCVPQFSADDVATVGNWRVLVQVVFPDGKQASFPDPDQKPEFMRIAPDLNST